MDPFAIGSRGRIMLAALCCAALFSAGCQSIPDLSAWDQATREVSGAVTEGFHASAGINAGMARRLERIAEDQPDLGPHAKGYRSAATALEARAVEYEKLFAALTDYSASLAAIARANANSSKTVDGVASSLNGLLQVVGSMPLAGASLELGKLLASEAIQVKAASDFADAVGKADPAIGRIAELVVRDLGDLRKTVALKDEPLREAITSPWKASSPTATRCCAGGWRCRRPSPASRRPAPRPPAR